MLHRKQIQRLLAAAVLLLTITGCDVKKALETITEPDTTPVPAASDSVASETQDELLLSETDTYTVSLLPLNDDGTVSCAQISCLADADVQNRINQYLRTLEQDRLNSMNGKYQAMPQVHYAGESILSLTQRAEFDGGGYSRTPLNFDLTTGEEIELSDVADTRMLAERIFHNENITIVDGYSGASVQDFIEDEHMTCAEDVQEYIETYFFHFNEGGNIVIDLYTSKGLISVIMEE